MGRSSNVIKTRVLALTPIVSFSLVLNSCI